MKKQLLFIAASLFAAFLFFGTTASAQWVVDNGVIWTNQDVGIKTDTPEFELDVNGNLGLGNTAGIFVRRSDNALQEIFSMDTNNDLLFNRGSITEDFPSHVIVGVGPGRRFEVRNSNNERIIRVVEATGFVGINTIAANPGRHLEVNGDFLLGKAGRMFVRRQDNAQHEMFSMDSNNDILFNRGSINDGLPSGLIFGVGPGRNVDFRNENNQTLMRLVANTGDLYVDGKITTTEIEVKLDIWPDFVFADDYNLMSIHELEGYILKNRHLPSVPSEAEVLENGVELGQMSAILLQKIEELTLYMIQISKENEELRQRISAMEK